MLMIQAISRVLAVFITISSIAFLTFSILQVWWFDAFPNYRAMANELKEASFDYTPGENPTYSSKLVLTGENISTSPLLAKTLLDAYKKVTNEKNTALQAIQDPPITADAYLQIVAQDKAAVEKAYNNQHQELAQIQSFIQQKTQEAAEINNQTMAKRKEAELRRQDVFRQHEQLDELKVERQRLSDLQNQVRDMIMRVEGNLIRLENRNQQLIDQSS